MTGLHFDDTSKARRYSPFVAAHRLEGIRKGEEGLNDFVLSSPAFWPVFFEHL
jgi:hypothetical protein